MATHTQTQSTKRHKQHKTTKISNQNYQTQNKHQPNLKTTTSIVSTQQSKQTTNNTITQNTNNRDKSPNKPSKQVSEKQQSKQSNQIKAKIKQRELQTHNKKMQPLITTNAKPSIQTIQNHQHNKQQANKTVTNNQSTPWQSPINTVTSKPITTNKSPSGHNKSL